MQLPDQLSLKQWARWLAGKKDVNGEFTSEKEGILLDQLLNAVGPDEYRIIANPPYIPKPIEDILIAWLDGLKNLQWNWTNDMERREMEEYDPEKVETWKPKYFASLDNQDEVTVRGADLKKFISGKSKYEPRKIIKKAYDSIPPDGENKTKKKSGRRSFPKEFKDRAIIEIMAMLAKQPHLLDDDIIYHPRITEILRPQSGIEPNPEMIDEIYNKAYKIAPSGVKKLIRKARNEYAAKNSPENNVN